MRRLGDILIEQGTLSAEVLESAFKSKPRDILLGDWLVQQQLLSTAELGNALADQFEVPYMDIDPSSVNPQIARLIPEEFARSHEAGAVDISGTNMILAMVAPDDIETISEAELMTGYQIRPVVAMADDVQALISRVYDDRSVARQTIVDMKLAELRETGLASEDAATSIMIAEQEDAPVVRLVQAILSGAVSAGASDVHLEPFKPEMRVRYRVDGELQQVMTIPNHIEDSVISRIKVMAEMDTTENRRPQDGHLNVFENGKRVGFRVSGIPTVDGQKLVLRLLDEGGKTFQLDNIGMTHRDLETLRAMIDKPHGMFVVTGPTGSGKSTTLYAALQHLNRDDRNIVTVEDPVEFRLPGINQVQSDNEFGMGFANALKYIMRQDPDVIMVGEIRDSETATTAIQAALTGHLMISTLHTNDAVGAVQRLSDLGVDNFKIAGSLLGSVAQRLLRCVCENCKIAVPANENLLDALDPGTDAWNDPRNSSKAKAAKNASAAGSRGGFRSSRSCRSHPRSRWRSKLAYRIRSCTTDGDRCRDGGTVRAGLEQALAGRTSIEEVYFKTSGDRRSEEAHGARGRPPGNRRRG